MQIEKCDRCGKVVGNKNEYVRLRYHNADTDIRAMFKEWIVCGSCGEIIVALLRQFGWIKKRSVRMAARTSHATERSASVITSGLQRQ